jgi:hypothetical protein
MQDRRLDCSEHYAYEKLGSCALLAAIEPLTGFRLAQVHERRMNKNGNHYLHYYLVEAADKLRQYLPEYQAFYQRKYA